MLSTGHPEHFTVAVIMSCYEGEKYVKEQVMSVLQQTYPHVLLFVRDDGSRDHTPEILTELKNDFPDKITICQAHAGENLGIRESFESVMKEAEGYRYYAFADQDDLWHPRKLELLMQEMKKTETGTEPCLVFSDMEIFSSDTGQPIHPSYLDTFKVNQQKIDAGLYRGLVPGCLMLFNRQAYNMYFENARHRLHDYNMFINCTLFGRVSVVKEKLLQYRVHSNNAYGLTSRSAFGVLMKDLLKYFFSSRRYRQITLNDYYIFYQIYEPGLKNKPANTHGFFSHKEVEALGWLQRKRWYLRHFNPVAEHPLEGLVQLILI